MDDKIVELRRPAPPERRAGVVRGEHGRASARSTWSGSATATACKDALRATMVKRAVDVPTFDALFDLYFSGLGEIVEAAAGATQDALELDRGRVPAASSSELERAPGGAGHRALGAGAGAAAGTTPARLERLLREAARAGAASSDIERGVPGGAVRARAWQQALGLGDARATSCERLSDALGAGGADPTAPAAATQYRRPPPAGSAGHDQGAGAPASSSSRTSAQRDAAAACRRSPRRASTISPRTRSAA